MIRQESEGFRVPEGTFDFLETAFTGPKGKAVRGAQFKGDPERVQSKLFGRVELHREVGGLRIVVIEGDQLDSIIYQFVVGANDSLRPSTLAEQLQPGAPYAFLTEAAIERGVPMPELSQDKVDELFGLARQTITSSH